MSHPIPATVLTMIVRAAAARRIRRGRKEAALSALADMGRDLFPDADVYRACFTGRAAAPGKGAAPGWREIGDAFWREAETSRAARRMSGSFYTPEPVIDRILDRVMKPLRAGDALSGTVCDPAVGCGYFLLRLAERLSRRHGRERVRKWAAGLHGVDRDPRAVFLTRALLWLTLSDASAEFLPDAARFRHGDSLTGPAFGQAPKHPVSGDALDWGAAFPAVAAAGGFDVVLGNPPYEVLTNFSRHPERKALADAIRRSGFYADALSGQINLYRCFIERSLALLRRGGALSFVVPLSLARDGSAAGLRRRLLLEEGAGEWLLFGEKDGVLGGVTQSACVFDARRGAGAPARVRVEVSGERYSVTLGELRRNGGDRLSIPVLDAAGLRLWRWLRRHCSGCLSEAAEMRVGEVDQTVYRACMRDDDTGCVLARGTHVAPFHLDVDPTPGKERFLDLKRFLRQKGGSAAACRERAGHPSVVQLGIRNMESRPRLVAAVAPSGVYFGNSLNVYHPKPGVDAGFLCGVLNSRLLDWLFRVGSGNNNINLAEMRVLPFPAARGAEQAAAVSESQRECAAVWNIPDALAAARQRLDAAVEACYGVPGELSRPVFGDREKRGEKNRGDARARLHGEQV